MIRQQLEARIRDMVKEAYGTMEVPAFSVSIPDNSEHGDYATNVALVLAKALKKNPLEIANRLNRNPMRASDFLVQKTEVASPGFINFWLKPDMLHAELTVMLKEKNTYGESKIGRRKKVLIEFISANPTGPLTVANSRGGPVGDVLANILEKSRYRVTREYYVNDAGLQVTMLGHSVIGDDQSQYSGAYVEDLRRQVKGKDPAMVGKRAAAIVLKHIKQTVEKGMGIKMDVWFSERSLYTSKKVDKLLTSLKKKDLTYEAEGAVWFRASKYGDEKDRVIVKSDGEKTYLAGDFAYHENKFKTRKFDRVINIWGADHHGDIARVKAAVEVLGYKGKLEILIMQFVRVIKDGKPLSMSKRKGVFITADELLQEVGRDAFRFFFLMSSQDTHMDFNIDLAREQSMKNPVYYVQYAHARASSILAKQRKLAKDPPLKLLDEVEEMMLIRKMAQFPEVIEDIAGDYQVHRFTRYAMDLAHTFHSFYEQKRVITENEDRTNARLALVSAVEIILAETLRILGVSAPKKM